MGSARAAIALPARSVPAAMRARQGVVEFGVRALPLSYLPEVAYLSVSEFPFEDLLTAGAGIPIVWLAGYLDLPIMPGAGRGREVHGSTAPRSHLECSAADSAAIFGIASVVILGVVSVVIVCVIPHLVVLVLLELGHPPDFELNLQVLPDLLYTGLATSLRGKGSCEQRHFGRGVFGDRPEEACAQDRQDQERGCRRGPVPPSGAARDLISHLRQQVPLERRRRLIGGQPMKKVVGLPRETELTSTPRALQQVALQLA